MDHVQRYATLVVHQLHALERTPCCNVCCASCGVLEELATTAELLPLIEHAPGGLAEPWLVDGGVTLEWMRTRWSCQSSPACQRADDGPGPLCSCELGVMLSGWVCDAHPAGPSSE
jgi:hypothetical protein